MYFLSNYQIAHAINDMESYVDMSLNKKLTFFIGWSKLRILLCPYLINYDTFDISYRTTEPRCNKLIHGR